MSVSGIYYALSYNCYSMYGGALHIPRERYFLAHMGLLAVIHLTAGPEPGWQNCSCMDGVSKTSERGQRRPKWQCDVITMHGGDELDKDGEKMP